MSRQTLIFFFVVVLLIAALVIYHLNTDSPYNSEVFFGKELTHETGTQARSSSADS